MNYEIFTENISGDFDFWDSLFGLPNVMINTIISCLGFDFRRALNILQQLNLVKAFDLNKYKNSDKYSLDKHSEEHLDEFDPYEKIQAYTLTSYTNDLMQLCISPKDNMRISFKCNNCEAIFQNVNKIDYCPSCQSSNIEVLF